MGRYGSSKYFDMSKSYNQAARQVLTYDEAVKAWAESLTPADLAALCADYDRGSRDPADVDAKIEWRRRHPGRGRGGRGNKTPLGRCAYHKAGRRPNYCTECDRAEEQRSQSVLSNAIKAEPDIEARIGSQAIQELPDELPDNSHADLISA